MKAAAYRILVADDHFVVCEGLRAVINREADLTAVGLATNGVQAVSMARELRPDLIILDLRMPELSGLEAIRTILAERPEARILILSTFDGDEDIRQAIHAGAAGYVVKRNSGEQIVPAIRAILSGDKWIPDDIKRQLARANRQEPLSMRELALLEFVARGDSNKEIGDRLQITENTVKTHLRNIMAKLGARDRTEAVTIGLRRGLIQLGR